MPVTIMIDMIPRAKNRSTLVAESMISHAWAIWSERRSWPWLVRMTFSMINSPSLNTKENSPPNTVTATSVVARATISIDLPARLFPQSSNHLGTAWVTGTINKGVRYDNNLPPKRKWDLMLDKKDFGFRDIWFWFIKSLYQKRSSLSMCW